MTDHTHPTTCEVRSLQIALAILLATLLATNLNQTVFLYKQHSELALGDKQLARDDVRRQLGEASLVGRKLDAVVRELATLAPTNGNAKRILEEFHIPVPAAAPAPARK